MRLPRGEPRAWREMVRRFGPLVHRLAYGMLRSESQAEDATQETFLSYAPLLRHLRPDPAHGAAAAPAVEASARGGRMIAQVLIGLVAAVAALVALVVLVPFHLRAEGALRDGSAAAAAEVGWGPGLLGLRLDSASGLTVRLLGLPLPRLRPLRPGRQRPGRRRARREKKERERRRRPARGGGRGRLDRLLRHRGELLRMALRLARPLRLRGKIRGRVGTGDPADVALLAALARAAGGAPGVELDLAWDWLDEVLDLDGELSARLWIVHLLGVALPLLVRRESRAALSAVRG